MKKVDSLLQVQQTSDGKDVKAQTDRLPTTEERMKNQRSIRRISTKIRPKPDVLGFKIPELEKDEQIA